MSELSKPRRPRPVSPPSDWRGRLAVPSLWGWREVVLVGLMAGAAIEALTVVARFGLGFQSTRDTGFLAYYTLGVRVHHGYVGLLLLTAAAAVRSPGVRRWLAVAGIALVSSDLLHHLAVLWPVTGSPQFDLVYPADVNTRGPEWFLAVKPYLGWGLWLAGWAIRLAALFVVPVGRPPASAAAWLLTVFLFPWGGLLLYALIGSPRMPRWRRRKLARFERETAELHATARAAFEGRETIVKGDLAQVARLTRRLGHFPVTGGNRVEYLDGYDALFARLAADVDAARHHVHLLYYIAAADHTTEPVMAALERAAGRGVRCRLVYDAQGSQAYARGLADRLAGTGVELRAALPFRLLSRRGIRADLRNHRKLAAVDGRVGYVGSQNLIDRRFIPGIEYEDYVARVGGPVVPQLQLVFASDWWLETDELLIDPAYFPEPDDAGDAVGQVLPSGPDFPTQNFQRVLVDVVHQARKTVGLVTPYLVPDDSLLAALETATRRGVRVRVIVSAVADQFLVRVCQESYYAQMLRAGVELYQYPDHFLHAKLGTADGELAVIGSCNADIRSFQLNAEVCLLLYDPTTVAGATAREDYYVSRSSRLTAEQWDSRPIWRRPVENLARVWSPLL